MTELTNAASEEPDHREIQMSEHDRLELSRSLTVDPFPETLKAEGGILLDTEGLKGPDVLRLAKDGHV
jgi:hypothetical protein